MSVDFEQLKDWLFPLLTALAVWFGKDKALHALNIKREKKSQETITLENLQKKLDIYQEMLTDVPQQYKAQIAELKAQAIELEESFKASMQKLQEEIAHLRKINNDLEKMVREQQSFIARQSSSLAYYERKFGKIVKS